MASTSLKIPYNSQYIPFKNLAHFLTEYKKSPEIFQAQYYNKLSNCLRSYSITDQPLTLEDVKILTNLNYDFPTYLKFTEDAYYYLIKHYQNIYNSLDKIKMKIFFQLFLENITLERFKYLLKSNLNCDLIQEKNNLDENFNIHSKLSLTLNSDIYHSLYYYIRNEEILNYLYQNNLDIHQNFHELFISINWIHFIDHFDLTLISEKDFSNFLGRKIFYVKEEFLERIYNFIIRYLQHYNYFELKHLEYLLLLKNKRVLTLELNSDFLNDYLKEHLTLAVIEEYISLKHYNIQHLIEICQILGFEKLPFSLHQKLFKMVKEEVYIRIIELLKKFNYPYMLEMKEDFLKIFWAKIRELNFVSFAGIKVEHLGKEEIEMILKNIMFEINDKNKKMSNKERENKYSLYKYFNIYRFLCF